MLSFHLNMTKEYILLLLIALLGNTTCSKVYHIVPDGDNNASGDVQTLQYYIMNISLRTLNYYLDQVCIT